MAVGDIITAARYNNIRARVASILGVGAGDEGYGQGVTSSSVAVGAIVTAQDMTNLDTDMTKIRLHQTGSNPTEIDPPEVGDIIEDSNSTTKEGYAQYESLSITCQASRLSAASSQMGSTEPSGGTSSRTADWNFDINHIFRVSFAAYTVTNGDGSTTTVSAADHMRVFFNAGGTLNVRGTIGSGGGTLNNDWRNLMNAVGTVKMGRSSTSNGSVGTSYGYANLPSSYVTIFNKAASAYSANDYLVEAKKNASSIDFRVTFNEDKGANPNFDENVTATTTSIGGFTRANNTNSVNVPAPTYSTSNNL
tara:strand:+ start:2655 stop:3575 length:921 start_codon:yes stop_codon:yes gene_type:complete